MPDAFDPYWKWLGIRTSAAARTPDHYRLLGIELFEDDADVICAAADRQMTHVRSYQAGPHALACQRILNELSAAKICLLNPAKKAAYDEKLRLMPTRSASSHDRQPDGDGEQPPQIRVATDHAAFAPRGGRRPQRPILPRILAVTSVLTVVGLIIYARRHDTGAGATNTTSTHAEQTIRPTNSASTAGARSQHAAAGDENSNGGASSSEQVGESGESPFPVVGREPEPSVVPDRAPGNFVWPDELESASAPLLAGGPFGQVWGELARRNPTLAMVHARRLRGAAGKEFGVEDMELVEAIVQGIATFWTTVQSNEPQINVGDRLPWADGTVVVAGIERSVAGQATITLRDSAGTAKKFPLSRGAMPAELAASLFMYPQSTVRGQAALQLGLFFGLDREAHVDRARTLLDASVAEGGLGSMTIAQLEGLGRSSRPDRVSVLPDVATNPAAETPDVTRPLPSDVDIPPSVAESSPFQPPTAAEYEELMELVRTALGTRWQERSSAARREIASDLIVRAREPGIGTPAKYVLWNEVRKIGLEGGDVYLSLSASRQLAALYGERAGPGKMAELLNEIATHRGTKTGLENVLDAAIATAQEAVVVEDFASASTMYDLAIKLARRLNFRDALAPLRQREAWVRAASSAAERFEVSVEKLRAEPMDAVANETVGRYLCFVRQDFAAGLAHMRYAEKGLFQELSAAEHAMADERRPAELAEMWLKAKSETASYEQPALLLRTRYWYEQAIKQATGLQKAAAEQRYRDIVEQYEAIVPEIVVARDLIPLVQPQRDSIDGQWRQSEQGLHSASSHYARLALPIRVRGSFQLRLVFTRLEGEPGNFATFPVGMTNASIVMNGKTDKRFVLGLVMVKNRWISDRADGVTAPLARGVRYVSEIRVVKNNRGAERVAIEAKVYADDASLRIAPQSYAWEGPIADLRVTELFTARPHQGNIVIGGNQVETIFHECRLLVAPDGEAELLVP